MFKKILSLFIVLSLCACASNRIISTGGQNEIYIETNEVNVSRRSDFRVGVLLPLSGEFAKQGNGLKNATMMALEDINDNGLVLQYYDTKGTPEGASVAVENALNQGSQLIIGPMLSSSVQAITPMTKAKGVPVIAFNSATDVLQDGIYTMGLLLDEQVERIIAYAVRQGKSRFALLLPDNNTGLAVARAGVRSAAKNNAAVTAIAFYKPGTTDFSDVLRQMTKYNERAAKLKNMKSQYASAAAAGNTDAIRVMKKLDKMDTYGGVDFDAVLIPDYGSTLKSAVAMFGYYDVFSPEVTFLGTSIWDNTNLTKETTMRGSWYPSLTRQNVSYFANKYNEVFGERPSALYAFGYDAVALASVISRNDTDNLNEKITNPEGYAGINGVFRFFANGKNQHSLDIKEVRPSGNYIVEAGPRKFINDDYYEEHVVGTAYKPAIYGKDQAQAEMLIFGDSLTPVSVAY